MPQNRWDLLAAEIEAKHAKSAAPPPQAAPVAPVASEDATAYAGPQPSSPQSQGFASSAWEQVNPANIVKGLWKAGGDAAKAMLKYQMGDIAGATESLPIVADEARRIKGVWTRPDTGNVNDKTINRVTESIPILGGIARKASDQSLAGNWKGAAGTVAGGVVNALYGPKALSAAGQAVRVPVRAAARGVLGPSMSEQALQMTGQTGKAARNALADAALDHRAMPRAINPRINPADKALSKVEGKLQSGLSDPGRHAATATAKRGDAWTNEFKRTGDAAKADAAAGRVPATVGDDLTMTADDVNRTPFVRDSLARAQNLEARTKMQARNEMSDLAESFSGPSQTASSIAAETATMRPIRRGTHSQQTPWRGDMGRAQLQGRRQVLADQLDAAGQPDLAKLARETKDLAALDEMYSRYDTPLTAEGAPQMQVRQVIGLLNRGVALPVRAGARVSDAMKRTGQWADDSLTRKALLASMAQSGRDQR